MAPVVICPHPEIAPIVEQFGEATCPECGQVGPGMVVGLVPESDAPSFFAGPRDVLLWILLPWVQAFRWLARSLRRLAPR